MPLNMNLVIVESPTKAKMLDKFLGKGYKVLSSKGHVRDLPKSKISIDIEHDFTPVYEEMEKAKETIAILRKQAKEADSLFLATDPDREGEAIAWHLVQILDLDKAKSVKRKAKNYKRVSFHEITKEAVEEAFKNPREVDLLLVDAQQARRILDRLVGYKLSPLLWKKIRRGLSAGRVQSVTVRFIVEREREIEKFGKEIYFAFKATFSPKKGDNFDSYLEKVDDKNLEIKNTIQLFSDKYQYTSGFIKTADEANALLSDLTGAKYVVSLVKKDEQKRYPYPPFTTSSLQQEASLRLSLSPKNAMRLAQKLYENGFITYMRTDSINLAPQAVDKMRNFIVNKFGKSYLPDQGIFYKTKSKNAQEAHEAIRPTDFSALEDQVSRIKNDLGPGEGRLFDLIFRRAVSSQMLPAIYNRTDVEINATGKSGKNYLFKASGRKLKFDGFLKIYRPNGDTEVELPELSEGEQLNCVSLISEEKQTTPPPRYNEASLIKELEKNGIGRPSTYAPILTTIQDRFYAEKKEGRLYPTAVGIAVNDFLVGKFEEVVGIPFTAAMESDLDDIASGEKKWVPVLREFYKPFEKDLVKAEKSDRVPVAVEKTGEKCPKCGADLIIRTGRFGRFISCSAFPDCDYKASIKETIGMKCPDCKTGDIVIKRTKRRRAFYGCSRYPDCKWASWKKPKSDEAEKPEDQASAGTDPAEG